MGDSITVRTVTVLLALLLTHFPKAANALDFERRTLEDGRVIVFATGKFVDGDASRLNTALLPSGSVDEVWFRSPGGLERSGYQVGRLLRRKQMTVRVPAGSTCASACTDAFLGGLFRYADRDRSIGVHMATRSRSEQTQNTVTSLVTQEGDEGAEEVIAFFEQSGAKGAAAWTSYVMEMGASKKLVEAAVKVPAGDMLWLTRQQMFDFNVVNVVE